MSSKLDSAIIWDASRGGSVTQNSSATLILCYHKVGPQAEEGRFLNVAPADLDRQARFLTRLGYVGRRLDDETPFDRPRCVVFTFDDAYASTLHHAPEILERHGIPGVFFAVTGKTESDWDGDRARPLAEPAMLKAAAARGHEIGNHSHTHQHLAKLSAPEQREELKQAHAGLEQLGIRARSVCYPYGSFNHDTLIAADGLGYRRGVSLAKGWAHSTAPRLALPRIVIAYSDGLAGFVYRVFVRPKLRRGAR